MPINYSSLGGSSGSNDFILDKNNTDNDTFVLSQEFAAGGYSLSTNSGDTSYDVYLINASGSAVGYTNGASIVASEAFDTVVVLGVGTAESISFTYNGPSAAASAKGQESGAAAYLTSISPSDLGAVDDTATVTGGNFASDLELAFISGTVVKPAKNVVVGSSTSAVVTRPDDLIEDEAPYDLRAINPGVAAPTGSNPHILLGTVTAGTDPSFVTTSPILGAQPNAAFSSAILTSDSEGSVVNWEVTAGALPSGLSLATATGVISGTPTVEGEYTFTIQITDDASNVNSQEFTMPVGLYLSGGSAITSGGTVYHTFTSSDTFEVLNVAGTANLEYVIVAGGGGGNNSTGEMHGGGGGGAGGLLWGTASITSDLTSLVSVGAGGAAGSNGANTYWESIATATGGGRGGNPTHGTGGSGGSGGGGGSSAGIGGTGIPGQGFAGNNGSYAGGMNSGGGGGGASETSATSYQGGSGMQFGAWASAIGFVVDNGYFAGGGGAGRASSGGSRGLGGGGDGSGNGSNPGIGTANTGGGGGGAGRQFGAAPSQYATGGSGIVLVRKI